MFDAIQYGALRATDIHSQKSYHIHFLSVIRYSLKYHSFFHLERTQTSACTPGIQTGAIPSIHPL